MLRGLFAAGALTLTACAGDNSTAPATTTTATAPTISSQPVSLILTRGTGGSMGVTAAGTAPLAYQWYHDSVAITGAVLDTLKVPSAADADSGAYYVTVTNPAGTVSSKGVVVLVRPPVSATAWRQEGGAAVANERVFSSTAADESAVYVFNGGLLNMILPNVTKSGASSSLPLSRSRGQNAAVLSAAGSRIYVTGGTIGSTDAGAAALFSTGAGSRLNVTNGIVSTAGASSPAIGASNGASMVITGGSLTATASDAVDVSAAGVSDAPVAITLAGGAAVSTGTGTLFSVTSGAVGSITLDSETVTGNVTADATSSASVVLQHLTALAAAILGASVTLDATSTWTLTANSTIMVLSNPTISGTSITNIVGNGFTVTYSAALVGNAALGGKTYALAGGGQLVPR